MQIIIHNLPDHVEQFIERRIADGSHTSAEEVVTSILLRESERESPLCESEGVAPMSRADDHAAIGRFADREASSPERTLKDSRGMLAHLNVPISFEEIEEISQEACKNFPREFPST